MKLDFHPLTETSVHVTVLDNTLAQSIWIRPHEIPRGLRNSSIYHSRNG